MTKRLPKSIYDVKFPPLWKSGRRTLANGWRVVAKRGSKSRHCTGGASLHKGATCPKCHKRLTLLWNLDLSDSMISAELREGLLPVNYLPFYICWQCVAASYRVTSDQGLTCFDNLEETLEDYETPFQDAPHELPRRLISLERIPSTIDALLGLVDAVGLEALDKPARQEINAYYKTKVDSVWDLPFSQFGGQPLLYQGHRDATCPNPKCPASKLEHPSGEFEMPYLMKELAVIHHDHEPELAKQYFQLLYYVCAICFSMRGEYRCS